jgi:hypothetical protein
MTKAIFLLYFVGRPNFELILKLLITLNILMKTLKSLAFFFPKHSKYVEVSSPQDLDKLLSSQIC